MLLHSSMVNTYYIKLFCMRTSRRHTTILLMVADALSPKNSYGRSFLINLENLNCGLFVPKYKSSLVIGLYQVLQIKNSQQYVKKKGKFNLDKVVKRRTSKQTPLGLEDLCVVYGIVSEGVLSLLCISHSSAFYLYLHFQKQGVLPGRKQGY